MAQLSNEDVDHQLTTLREYLKRLQLLKSEIATLNESVKDLKEEFKDKLDMKTLGQAIAVANTKRKVAHKFTFDNILKILEDEGIVV